VTVSQKPETVTTQKSHNIAVPSLDIQFKNKIELNTKLKRTMQLSLPILAVPLASVLGSPIPPKAYPIHQLINYN
jgi:hypothetical protein